MMGANHGAVDHLQRVWNGTALVQSIHDLLPLPGQRPTSELAVNAGPFAELFGQVTPWGSGSRDPENPIKNKAMVGGFAPVGGADRMNEMFKERPFLVRHQVSCQADLH